MSNSSIIPIIQEIVEDYFGLTSGSSSVTTRKREIVTARQIIMFFAKDFDCGSLALIGSMVGEKDHSTVVHACKTINNLIDTDPKIREEVEEIRMLIESKTKLLSNFKKRELLLKQIFMLGMGVIVRNRLISQNTELRFDFDVTVMAAKAFEFDNLTISKYVGCDKVFIEQCMVNVDSKKVKRMIETIKKEIL